MPNTEQHPRDLAELAARRRARELRNQLDTLLDESDDTSATCWESRRELRQWKSQYLTELLALENS